MNNPTPTISIKQYQTVLDGQQNARRQVAQLRQAIEDALENVDNDDIMLTILGAALDASAPKPAKSKPCGCGD